MTPTRRYTPSLEMQKRTRKERGFDETEQDLPGLYSSLSAVATAFSTKDKLYAVLSYLGLKNPVPRPVTADDTVWLLDNTAYRNKKTSLWEAEYVAAVFSQRSSLPLVYAVDAIAGKIGLEAGDPGHKTLEERIGPFVQDIKPGTKVKALHRGRSPIKLGPGGHNGISSQTKKLPEGSDGEVVPTIARVPKGANGLLEMRTFYAEAEGWGVISGTISPPRTREHNDRMSVWLTRRRYRRHDQDHANE